MTIIFVVIQKQYNLEKKIRINRQGFTNYEDQKELDCILQKTISISCHGGRSYAYYDYCSYGNSNLS